MKANRKFEGKQKLSLAEDDMAHFTVIMAMEVMGEATKNVPLEVKLSVLSASCIP